MSTRATIHLVASKKCFSCPLVVGLTMLLLHPPQVALVVVFFMFLAQQHYFLPCGFDLYEVVPIKAPLES